MRKTASKVLFALFLTYICTLTASAEDLSMLVKKAVEKSTLDQPGTKPFHLKATYAPSRERDKDSNRNGEIEIWWESPTRWRRELKSPDFHQIAILDGTHQWQKNEGNYFPEWLRQLTVAIIRPVPLPMKVLEDRIKNGDVKRIGSQMNVNWDAVNGSGDAQTNAKGYIAVNSQTDQLFYCGGLGWGALYKNFQDFHGRTIARIVSSGHIEVTAKVTTLEDLDTPPPGFFDTNAPGGDPQPIETVVLDENELRKNLLPDAKPFVWSPVADGPFEGVVWTEIVLDRTGNVRDMIPPIADNPRIKDAADQGFRSMHFQPIMRNGVPVQAIGKLTEHFKTGRPEGAENFDCARNYFAHARKLDFLAAGATSPYTLHAEFEAGTPSGVQSGRYQDTWLKEDQWRREAWLGPSHLVRTQDGEKHYVLAESGEERLLRVVMLILEPLPADDTMRESDWRIRRDTLNGAQVVRVYRGPEGPNGELEPGKSQVYWFDASGHLVKSFVAGAEVLPAEAAAYDGVHVARQINVMSDGKVTMHIVVKDLGPPDPEASKTLTLKGHEWQRAFTPEAR
jgi:hypothetical protein